MAAKVTFKSVAGLNKALRKLPKDATVELRDASQDVSERVALEARQEAEAQGGIAALVAPTIRARRDRVPKIAMGGTSKLPESGSDWTHSREGDRQTVGDVMWGAEFGALQWLQFQPWRGNDEGAGYFLWPAVRDNADWIDERYGEALDDAIARIKP